MAPKFGTSGLRGLVTDLTEDLVQAHVQAFLSVCETGPAICLGRDLRSSSPQIAAYVTAAARAQGTDVIDCGALATPALALAAARAQSGAVMITGSHIPADRNGLKFYTRGGHEITKVDEARILEEMGQIQPAPSAAGALTTDLQASERFVTRYVTAFGDKALKGRRLGVFEHSAVGRQTIQQVLRGLGAEVIALGRSDHFVPVDTEAVDPAIAARIRDWVADHRLDALVSSDGDSDRPLLADETGQIIPGDILGQITAELLQAQTVVTPISSNSGVMEKGFTKVLRTQIGSPFVIASMQDEQHVVGYEANGGFLLGFEAAGPAGPLPPLETRDCVLPVVATLCAAAGGPVSTRVTQEPAIFTRADRLQEVPTAKSQALVAQLTEQEGARAAFLARLNHTQTGATDLTDGLRIPLDGHRILHIRPSGNAPELRLYVEAGDAQTAAGLLSAGLTELRRELKDPRLSPL